MKKEKIDSQMILKSLQELIEAGKDTDQRMKDTDQRMKDTDQYIKQISKKIDKLQDIVGGIGNSQGLAAEEEFFNSFAKTMSLGNLKFHAIDRNLRRHSNGLQDEFDIVLTNSELIMIVEVKYNFHPNDVQKVLNKISNYKKLYPQHHNFNIYGAIAGKVLSKKTIDEATKYQLFVIAQEGNDIRIINSPLLSDWTSSIDIDQ